MHFQDVATISLDCLDRTPEAYDRISQEHLRIVLRRTKSEDSIKTYFSYHKINVDIVGHLWYNIIMHILRLYCQDVLGIGLDVIGPSQDKTSMSKNYSRINLISHMISTRIHNAPSLDYLLGCRSMSLRCPKAFLTYDIPAISLDYLARISRDYARVPQ